MYKSLSPSFLLYLLLTLSTAANAQTVLSQAQFVQKMVAQHGFNPDTLNALFAQADIKPSIIKAITPPANPLKVRPFYQYRKNFINDKRIQGGAKFWREHAQALSRAEQQFGVPAEIIIAIIGVETAYGDIMGNFRVWDALTTLAFHYPRRAAYFQEELEAFLLMCRTENINPLQPRGSYAGAMGLGQFMPSSFQKYAIDFNGDGHRNIWTDETDAIGSIANYFKSYGWRANEPIIEPTQVKPAAVRNLLALEYTMQHPLSKLKDMGLLYYGQQPDQTFGLLIDLQTENGIAYWVGFNNFYVITRYNRSNRYAMSVYQLAQLIAETYYYPR